MNAGGAAPPPRLTWGINRWVLVDGPAGSVQRQVSSPAELGDLLVDAGVPPGEVDGLAAELWHGRPRDAGFESARRDEAMWRSTGLPAWAIFLLLALVAALLVLRFAFR